MIGWAPVVRALVFDVAMDIADGWHLYAHGDTVFYGIALKGPEKAAGEPATVVGQKSAGPSSRSVAWPTMRTEFALPLDAMGQVDRGPHDAILGPALGADVAHHHLPGVQADAHLQPGRTSSSS